MLNDGSDHPIVMSESAVMQEPQRCNASLKSSCTLKTTRRPIPSLSDWNRVSFILIALFRRRLWLANRIFREGNRLPTFNSRRLTIDNNKLQIIEVLTREASGPTNEGTKISLQPLSSAPTLLAPESEAVLCEPATGCRLDRKALADGHPLSLVQWYLAAGLRIRNPSVSRLASPCGRTLNKPIHL
jgi:hypothetical protein